MLTNGHGVEQGFSGLANISYLTRLPDSRFEMVVAMLIVAPTIRGIRIPTIYTQHSTLPTPHSALRTPHSTPNTQQLTLHTQHSTLHTQHSTLNTQHAQGFEGLANISYLTRLPDSRFEMVMAMLVMFLSIYLSA